MFRVYFTLFRNILKNPIEAKKEIFKKDRTKSKKLQMRERKKALQKLKAIEANGDIDEEENKIVELILKGINILMARSKEDLRVGSAQQTELKTLLEAEMDTLFKLTHHKVFRI